MFHLYLVTLNSISVSDLFHGVQYVSFISCDFEFKSVSLVSWSSVCFIYIL